MTSGAFALDSDWSTTTGQNVIKSLNGGSTATSLAQWLATTFPNLYGSGAGSHSLVNSNGTYFTNAQVASAYSKFTGADEQVLSAALSVYATSINLAGTNVDSTDSHFVTSLAGSGTETYSVGANGAAFGVANNTTLSVQQLMVDLNANTKAGAAVSSGGNAVFSGINSVGNVANATLSADGLAYSPAQIRTAYGINDLSLDGTGQTIAIVDAYDNPAIFQSVDTFDSQFGTTTTGPSLSQQYGAASSFLTVVGQDGSTADLPQTDPAGAGNANWETEEALDVEWVHAIAPGAQIVLVEANSQSLSDLMSSVSTAANLPGVSVVSMSWGFPEGQSVFASDEACSTTATSPRLPATRALPGGQHRRLRLGRRRISLLLAQRGGGRLAPVSTINADNSVQQRKRPGARPTPPPGRSSSSGGGTSLYEPEPYYQMAVQSTGYRSTPDVSFDADPNTGAWVADPYNLSTANPWEVVGGTSLAAPAWAGLVALANQGRAQAGETTLNSSSPTQTQQALYSLPSSDFNDVTTGSNEGAFSAPKWVHRLRHGG